MSGGLRTTVRLALALALLATGPVSPAQALRKVEIPPQPSCVQLEQASLRFPGSREAQDRFYDKLDSLLAGGGRSVNIWHVGGSHVQAGFFPLAVISDIDSLTTGLHNGRGFFFPYTIADTNYDKNIRMSSTGEWKAAISSRPGSDLFPKYGITGMACSTTDTLATVSFGLNSGRHPKWRFNRLRIMGEASSDDVFPYVRLESGDTLHFSYDDFTSSYICNFREDLDSATVCFNIPEGGKFTLTGIEPVDGFPGVNYYSSGANGARLGTWLDVCTDLGRDLRIVHPDLAIFAVGINDSACSSSEFKPEKFKNNYRALIRLIRNVSPDCAFIFITNNDSYRYVRRGMTYNTNAVAVQKAMYQLAEEYGAGVWDLYEIMGGKGSIIGWRDSGLAMKDRLHFTKEGYTLLGDLFYNALVEDHDKR